MLEHERNVHHKVVKSTRSQNGLLKCDKCSHNVSGMDNLVFHHRVMHDFRAEIVQMLFGSAEEFDKWKLEEEESQHCRFIRQSGSSPIASGKLRTYYRCHRSGVAAPKRGKGARSRKTESCKTGKVCLSFITATRDIGDSPGASIEVLYQKNHYGHDRDCGRLPATPAEEAEVAKKLVEGVPTASEAAKPEDKNVWDLPGDESREHETQRVLEGVAKTKASAGVASAAEVQMKLRKLAALSKLPLPRETLAKLVKLLDRALEMCRKEFGVAKLPHLPKKPAKKKKRKLAVPSTSPSKPTELHEEMCQKQTPGGDLASVVISTSSGHEYC